MPLRCNRRQYEQLTDFDIVARCWQQWITEGKSVPSRRTQNDREDRAIRRVATSAPTSIDSTPLTSFQTSSAIKRKP
ncbi:hypothetical protein TNCV_795791 [Trichonephila clavipes]|nr:hypothetical protein TNCV_795791 [Trichonephila clavipes]